MLYHVYSVMNFNNNSNEQKPAFFIKENPKKKAELAR